MRYTVLLLVIVVSLGAVPNAGADGMLDPSFGNGGLVITSFPGGGFPIASALSLVVLPDGRAVAAGIRDAGDLRMAVARYLPSGALDMLTTVGCPIGAFSGAAAVEVLLQPDGRLILIGYCTGPPPGVAFEVARLNVDGSLDPSFGSGGQVVTPFATSVWAVSGVLQPDGRIVAVGHTNPNQTPTIVAARYNAGGTLDPTFGTAGQLTLPLPQSFRVADLALQPDGKLVIAGTYGSTNFALVRLLPGGAPDPAFDGDGLATASFGGTEAGVSVVVLPDGRLVLAGSHNTDFAMVRFLPDGAVDTTFGTGGLATAPYVTAVTPDEAIRLPNGKLMIAGFISAPAARDFLLARFHPDGPLDASFGAAGFLKTGFSPSSQDECYAVAMAGPDLVLAAGRYLNSPPFVAGFALARYIATTPVELLRFRVE